MAESRITLRHPEFGGTWQCPADAVDAWRAKGWTPESEVAHDGDESSESARGRTPKGSK